MGQFIDRSQPLPPYHGRPPAEMPHGLLAVPDWVREEVAKRMAKHPGVWAPEAVQRTLCDWTLQHYFEAEGYEVLYRPTPDGPLVVAVGDDERIAFRRAAPPDEIREFVSWLP